MPETTATNELPPRTTTSTKRGLKKSATLSGRTSASTTDIETSEITSSKTNGHRRTSSSLFRKASTISRTNETSTNATTDDPNAPSLKKSRSLMNVLRSKLHSPAVLRRFRSKSRESTKQTVTEISSQPTVDDPEPEIKPDENPEPTTRKSRKRDPSPMRRLANRLTQLTRHHKTTSPDRQTKSPSKSITIDSHEEIRKSSSPLHNKDEVEHINACYDEIRAKYFTSPNKRNQSVDQAHERSTNTKPLNGSLFIDDNNSSRISSILPTSDDPLLRARKQTNIKLNCLLSGYSLTTSFANHEKLYGQNNLFKFNHYYDVGKRKYDYNFTNANNRIFTDMKSRPLSKSIDSFRRTNVPETEIPLKLEKLPPVDHEPFVPDENQTNVSKLPAHDNELFIREDNDSLKAETNVQGNSMLVEQEKKTHLTNEEHDEEFERDFLRAVDRALGVVNKDGNNFLQTNEDLPTTKSTDESTLNLQQITEQALSSFQSSPLFQNEEQNNDLSIVSPSVVQPIDDVLKTEQPIVEDTPNVNTEHSDIVLTKSVDEKSTADQPSTINSEKSIEEDSPTVDVQQSTKEEPSPVTINELPTVDTEKSTVEDSPKVDIQEPTKDEPSTLINQEPPTIVNEKLPVEDSPKVDVQEPTIQIENTTVEESSAKEEPSIAIDKETPTVEIEKSSVEDSTKSDVQESTKEESIAVTVDESPKAEIEKSSVEEPAAELAKPTLEESPKVDTQETTKEESSTVIDKPTSEAEVEKPSVEDSPKVDVQEPSKEEPTTQIEQPAAENSSTIDVQESTKEEPSTDTHEEAPKVESEKATEEDLVKVDAKQSTNEDLSNIAIEKSTDDNVANALPQEPIKEEVSSATVEETSRNDSTKEDLSNVTSEKSIDDETPKSTDNDSTKVDVEIPSDEHSSKTATEELVPQQVNKVDLEQSTMTKSINEDIVSTMNELTEKVDELLFEDSKNGQTFLAKLNAEENVLHGKTEAFNRILQTEDDRLNEDVRTDINAVIGEVNLLLRGKLKQFRGLCEANVTKTSSGDPIPLDSDLEGFWDITYPLIDKVKEKFAKLDTRQANQWAPIEEYDPNDVNNRPRHPDDRSKQVHPHSPKISKIPIPKSANDDLKKLIQERRKAAAAATAATTNQNSDVEMFVPPK